MIRSHTQRNEKLKGMVYTLFISYIFEQFTKAASLEQLFEIFSIWYIWLSVRQWQL